jgi:UDP-N-acetylmuramoyl-tripeptide--D-alanyl-D-alanine ligase
VKGRLQKKASRNGATVIDDTYNANPDSVRAAIDVLANSPAPRVLVLGEMGEVGDAGPEFHAEIGGHAAAQKISTLLATGALCRHAVAAFDKNQGTGTARSGGAHYFENFEDLLAAVRTHDRPGATLLVKGSRYTRMERAVQALTGEEG